MYDQVCVLAGFSGNLTYFQSKGQDKTGHGPDHPPPVAASPIDQILDHLLGIPGKCQELDLFYASEELELTWRCQGHLAGVTSVSVVQDIDRATSRPESELAVSLDASHRVAAVIVTP